MPYGKRWRRARRISFRITGKRSGFSAIALIVLSTASRNSDPKPPRSFSYHRYAVSISVAAGGRVTTDKLTCVHAWELYVRVSSQDGGPPFCGWIADWRTVAAGRFRRFTSMGLHR